MAQLCRITKWVQRATRNKGTGGVKTPTKRTVRSREARLNRSFQVHQFYPFRAAFSL